MRRRFAQVGLALALAGCGALGCVGSSGRSYPHDPLFLAKKPVEAKPSNSGPIAVAYSEPALPPIPALVQAAVRKQPLPPTFSSHTTMSSPGQPVRSSDRVLDAAAAPPPLPVP